MAKTKILGEQYGITVTRPWSQEMYEHNNKVHEVMVNAINAAITKADRKTSDGNMRTIASAINAYGYGHGMEFESIKEDALAGLADIQNHWLHENTWPELVKAGLVKDIEVKMIGYDKL